MGAEEQKENPDKDSYFSDLDSDTGAMAVAESERSSQFMEGGLEGQHGVAPVGMAPLEFQEKLKFWKLAAGAKDVLQLEGTDLAGTVQDATSIDSSSTKGLFEDGGSFTMTRDKSHSETQVSAGMTPKHFQTQLARAITSRKVSLLN